jgi:hypothetical protein
MMRRFAVYPLEQRAISGGGGVRCMALSVNKRHDKVGVPFDSLE